MKKIYKLFELLRSGKFKLSLTWILFCFGYHKILPSSIINLVLVKENNEPLSDIRELIKNTNNIQLAESLLFFHIRKSVAFKIRDIAIDLEKKGIGIYIKCLYRDLALQEKLFSEIKKELLEKNSSINDTDVSKFAARPGLLSPHVTGGAIDVYFYNLDSRKSFDYGASIYDMENFVHFDSKNLTLAQKENRIFLRKTMEKYGFVCYPGEWWHYSYGDQAWAAYRGEKNALYGGILKL